MSPVRKILFVTLSNIGDAILTTPVLSILRGNFPDAKITVLASPRSFDVFAGSSMVNEVIIYDKTGSWLEKWFLVRDLRRYHFDLVVDLKNTVIPLILNPPLRTSVFRHSLSRIVSKREQHLACLKSLQEEQRIDMNLYQPFDFYSEEDLRSVKEKLNAKNVSAKSIVLMAPGANSHLKKWYADGFACVADKLVRGEKKQVIFIGSESDSPTVDEVLDRSEEKHVDFSGETTLRELAALLSLADCLVTNDSAPMQIAYEIKVPVVAIFGPTSEKKFGRISDTNAIVRKNLPCTPCESAHCLISDIKACLLEIPPDDVYQACLKILSRSEVSSDVSSRA